MMFVLVTQTVAQLREGSATNSTSTSSSSSNSTGLDEAKPCHGLGQINCYGSDVDGSDVDIDRLNPRAPRGAEAPIAVMPSVDKTLLIESGPQGRKCHACMVEQSICDYDQCGATGSS